MAEEKEIGVGDLVIFVDPKGVDHNALITTVWSPQTVNLVRMSDNPDEQDGYGRQIKRETSVPKMADHTAHGYYFRMPGEPKKEYVPPINQ